MTKYVPTDHIVDLIKKLFRFHPVQNDQPERYAAIREKFEELSIFIVHNTPPGPEQTLAIRQMHITQMLTISAIAVNEDAE